MEDKIQSARKVGAKPAHPTTAHFNESFKESLDFSDTRDFDDANRGFIGTLDEPVIRNDKGEIVWNLTKYKFLDNEESPESVNPSLWRMARLNYIHGLFKVCDGIYQVRGFDLANITFVETNTGLVVIDPLTFEEAAKAALQLYKAHRGDRRIHAVFYSHSHRDHYGGVRGIVDEEEVISGAVQIIAPDKFMEEVVSEAVLAGVPMRRRSQFQFGGSLEASIFGHVDSGLGKAMGRGTSGLIPPTHLIKVSGERMCIDGLEIEFQLTPGAEAPAEMNFYFPGLRALNMAENACHTMHNLCPLRGAKVRDALAWARYLDEAIELYADKVDVVYAQHHWPVFGRDSVSSFLIGQRDLYRYLHDQTLRWMSHGLTAREIAEKLIFPDEISRKWHTRGYYGAVVHNVQAIYAFYMGPYDGNPANLHPLPPSEAGVKYIAYMGGVDAVIAKAREDFESGEFRWVAQLMSHAVFANPTHAEARGLAADAFEQLGYQAESATWRNAYILAAREMRAGKPKRAVLGNTVSPDTVAQLPIPLFLDYLAIRVKGLEAAGLECSFDWEMVDEAAAHRITLSSGALNHRIRNAADRVDTVVRTNRSGLALALSQEGGLMAALDAGILRVEGNVEMVRAFLNVLDDFDPVFAVVEP